MTTTLTADEQEMIAEHQAGEHSGEVFIDCPICYAEWDELTGGAR